MDPLLEGEVLGVDPEGVEADRLEDVEALEALEAAEDVGAREGVDVPHVQPFGRRVGEHHQVVEGARGAAELLLRPRVRPPLVPPRLPLPLDLGGLIAAGDVLAAHGRSPENRAAAAGELPRGGGL
jgi:hypothetical protein